MGPMRIFSMPSNKLRLNKVKRRERPTFGELRAQVLRCTNEVISNKRYVEVSTIDLSSRGEDDGFDDCISYGSDQDTPNNLDYPTPDSERESLWLWDLNYWNWEGCMASKFEI